MQYPQDQELADAWRKYKIINENKMFLFSRSARTSHQNIQMTGQLNSLWSGVFGEQPNEHLIELTKREVMN